MTNHDLLPEAALNYSANWVVNEPGQPVKDGTLAIASKYFFKNYLPPKLAIVDRNTATKEDIRRELPQVVPVEKGGSTTILRIRGRIIYREY
ncbi:hypothetical protein RhiLY_08375 [Ceratobasidium sp. AG-Ba]|nr:hypothetical protein RhiLY_08375 [Ceratobasidium sp. AG-Ba]